MNITQSNRRSIEFEKIRNGTVFKYEGDTYIKGQDKFAVSLETGEIYEVPEGQWNECYMYVHASLNLTGGGWR